MTTNLKIALFGTSADPPTLGHREILLGLGKNYDIVAVWASDNPFKEHSTSLTERQNMLGLLIEEMDNQDNIVLREELSDRRSINSLSHARQIWGHQAEYTIVIGSDLVSQIQSWYKAQELLQQVKILIVPRLGYPIDKEALANLSKLGAEYAIADFQIPKISSSNYRHNGDQTMLTQKVANYINHKQLYN